MTKISVSDIQGDTLPHISTLISEPLKNIPFILPLRTEHSYTQPLDELFP